MTDEDYLRLAIDQSVIAANHGEYPYGAVLVCGNKVVVKGFNTTQSTRDIAAHAELSVIRQMGREFGEQPLKEATLYSSSEPCVMCSGAIYWSGIRRLVYGCSTELDATISQMPFAVPCRSILAVKGGHEIEIRGPLLEDEAATVLHAFWPKYLRMNRSSFGLAM